MKRTREEIHAALKASAPCICPSLLACDFGRLADEIAVAADCGIATVHWDVMDGRFVPNFTYGPPVIQSLRPASPLIFDAHLMMSNAARYLDDFLKAGCEVLTVHLEAFQSSAADAPPLPPLESVLERIRAGGALAGLAISPDTPPEALTPWIDSIDLVLIMSVQPGFGGQSFDKRALDKLRWVRANAPASLLLQVDGGVNATTIADVRRAGAELFVVGSAFYGAVDRRKAHDELKRLSSL
ncbi:MAG: ribulose-phosphate 3-epimerase [Planctomycetia bacterium]